MKKISLILIIALTMSCAVINRLNLLTLHKSEPKGVGAWFSTHPPTQSRIDFVRSEIAKLPNTAGLKKTSARFKQIRARVLRR